MKSQRALNVLLVAQHSGLREACRAVVELLPELQVCGEAASQAEAIRLLRTAHPDLVVIVLSFQYTTDLQLIRHIKTLDPSTKTLVFAIRDAQDEYLTACRCQDAGADLYVRNTGEAWRLAEALQALAGEARPGRELVDTAGRPLQTTEPSADFCAHPVWSAAE